MRRLVSILCLDEEEKRIAREGCIDKRPVSEQGDYVTGYAEDHDIERMAAAGLIVNVLEEDDGELAFGEDELPEALAEMALDDTGGGAAAETDDHFVIAFRRPLGSAEQQLIAQSGAQLGDRIGGNRYVLAGTLSQAHRLRGASELVANVSLYGIEATLAADLHRMERSEIMAGASAGAGGAEFAVEDAFDAAIEADDDGMAAAEAMPLPPPLPPPLPLHIRCHQLDEVGRLVALLKQHGGIGQIESEGLRIRCEPALGTDLFALKREIAALAATAQVEEYVEPELLLEFAVPGMLAAPPGQALAFDGAGETIAIADTGLDGQHPDFGARFEIVELAAMSTPQDPDGHGTHVASIAAGSGAASLGKLAGAAPGAAVFFQALAGDRGKLEGIRIGIGKILQQAFDKGARIHNMSWGSQVAAGYVLNSWELDDFIHRNPEHLVIVAAGNSGRQDGGGQFSIETVTAPATAKNALAVGACCSPRADGPFANRNWDDYPGDARAQAAPMTQQPLTGNPDVVAVLSSRGPAQGRRIKPDLVAPGIGIAAARSGGSVKPGAIPFAADSEHYVYKNGTSMAAPMVAGAAALLRQYLKSRGMDAPSAALMKAALINGAQWMRGPSGEDVTMGQPNFHQGFGRLELSKVIPVAPGAAFSLRLEDMRDGDPGAIFAPIKPSDTPVIWVRKLTVSDAAIPLSVTMAWTDPPGPGLTHELDLIVVAPDGSKTPGNNGIERPRWEVADRVNNVEQVRIANPAVGEWTVRVSGQNTYKGPQGFGIAASGAISDWILA